MLQDVIDLLPVIALGHGFRTEGGSHRRHGTRVIVHAVILGVDTLHGSERKYDQDKRQPFHHLFSIILFISLCSKRHRSVSMQFSVTSRQNMSCMTVASSTAFRIRLLREPNHLMYQGCLR